MFLKSFVLAKCTAVIVCGMFIAFTISSTSAKGDDSLYDAISKKIYPIPIAFTSSRLGKEIASWRLVTLRSGAGQEYGLTDQFFAEHVKDGEFAPFLHSDHNVSSDRDQWASRKIGYIIHGSMTCIALKDIVEDRGYDLEILNLLDKISTKMNEASVRGTAIEQEIESSQKKFISFLKDSGYATERMAPELVENFLRGRVADENGRAVETVQELTDITH